MNPVLAPGDWVTVGDSTHVWQVWDNHPKDSLVWLADGTRWIAAPRFQVKPAPAPTAPTSPYTTAIVRTAKKTHRCDANGCDKGIWPGDRYVLTKAFPGHDSGVADGTLEHGPRPVEKKLCRTHAAMYPATNLEGLHS